VGFVSFVGFVVPPGGGDKTMAREVPSDATLDLLSGTTLDPGIVCPEIGHEPHYTDLYKIYWLLAKLLAPLAGLRVYKDTSGDLKFGVEPGRYSDGDTAVSYAGASDQSLTDDATNSIYLTAAGALTVGTSGFPAAATTPHVPLATIATGTASAAAISGEYTFDDITDRRGEAIFAALSQLTAARANRLATLADSGVPWAAAVYDEWKIDGDGAETNGGGIVGDVTLTEAAAAYAKCYDHGTTSYANLAVSSGLTGWTANYQLTADAASEAVDDAVYFGADVPFPEWALDIATVATYGGDCGAWEYWNGAAWTACVSVVDHTDTTAGDGKRPFQQDGAIAHVPQSDWASCAVDSQTAYWVRWRITAAQVTQTPLTNSKEHELVTPTDGIKAPCDGQVTDLRASDGAATLHTTNDVKFMLWDFTKGTGSGELTWAQDKRSDAWGSLTMDVDAGDNLGVVVTQEDGTNEIAGALLEMTLRPA